MSDLLGRCDELAAITAVPGRVDRFHLTDEHARANILVAGWMHEAGLATWVDPAGNVCGRREGRTAGLPALLLGSHLDTVPDAGRYDGPLGVVAAIEVAARLRDVELPFALEVIGFSDEEGSRFDVALMGSRAVAGTWDEALLECSDAQGVTVREALRDFGLDPELVGEAARADLVGYVEAHIEQGLELDTADLPLGVVTSIAGARRFSLAVLGEARHAGGTPYRRRRDALVGASHAVLDIERIARASKVIATVGRLETFPGAVNVIPGRVEMTLDLRAERDADRDLAWEAMLDAIHARCSRLSLRFVAEEEHSAPAVACSPRLQDAVAAGIAATGQTRAPRLFSRAGHDAMAIAAATDVGMLFVRCHDGISHHPDEAVRTDDVDKMTDALEATVRHLAATA